MPEFGGRAVDLEPETRRQAPPAENLLLPGRGDGAANSRTRRLSADNVAAGEVSASRSVQARRHRSASAPTSIISPSN